MLFTWFDARQAADVGATLADEFIFDSASPSGTRTKESECGKDIQKFLQKFLQRVDRDAGPLKLNLVKRARLANSFKWRLLEKGVDREIVDELTRALVLRLSDDRSPPPASAALAAATTKRVDRGKIQAVLSQGDEFLARGAYAEAVNCYQELLALDERHAIAHNNLGAALCKLGRYKDAEAQFRLAVGTKSGYADAHCNLGTVLRWRGNVAESELPLRRALKFNPAYVEARFSLGTTLVRLGRLRDARECFEKVLKTAPRHVDALVGLAEIAAADGCFDEAAAGFGRALEIDPNVPGAWAGLVRLRRMTSADTAWLQGAEKAAARGLAPLEGANLRFAIGKYYDDVGDYKQAFRSYRLANELQSRAAEPYDRRAREAFVDDLIRLYTSDTFSSLHAGASDSERPVFVVGMPRSGTSLVEQIIASHPRATGAGELGFWSAAMHSHEAVIRRALPGEPMRRKLAVAYLNTLTSHSRNALRVVDKATLNFDYLGIIHSVFPNARMIYVRRDPVDTCLSCYFQQFSPALNFAMDLSDLAHYYRQHRRLIDHWATVLPRGTLLEVPYAQLTADQEGWTRRILAFLGLEWDEQCLDFSSTQRTVLTASFWQVRQQIFRRPVPRWHNYERFIGPLLGLKDLGP